MDACMPINRRSGVLAVIAFTGIASVGLAGCDYWPPALQTQIETLRAQLNDALDDRQRLDHELEELKTTQSSLQREIEEKARENDALQNRLAAMRPGTNGSPSAKAVHSGRGEPARTQAASDRTAAVRSPVRKGSVVLLKLENPYRQGPRVMELQRLLRRHKLPIRIDGVYGRDTAAAVRWFQRTRGLPASGAAGQATFAALRSPAHLAGPTRQLWLQRPPLKGQDVVTVQRALRRAGNRITIDGQFGPETDAAVTRFQRRRGLEPDGMVGSQTWAALMRTR